MTEVAARPVVSADLGGVLRLYRVALRRCWPPSALFALLWVGLLALLISKLALAGDLLSLIAQLQEMMSSSWFWRLVLAALLVSTWLYCAIVAAIHGVATGAAHAPGADFRSAVRLFPKALVAGTLFFALTSIGSLVFVVPGIYLWGMWQLWVVALVAEHHGPLQSLSTSWNLTRGFWWPATSVVTLATIVTMVPLMVSNALVSTLLALLGLPPAQALIVSLLALAVVTTLVAPLIPAALVAIYLVRQRAMTAHSVTAHV